MQLLKARDVAEILQVHPRTAYLWMHNGRIPTVQIGRTIRTPKAELERWIAQRTEPGR